MTGIGRIDKVNLSETFGFRTLLLIVPVIVTYTCDDWAKILGDSVIYYFLISVANQSTIADPVKTL